MMCWCPRRRRRDSAIRGSANGAGSTTGITIDRDVGIPMRDAVVVLGDLYRGAAVPTTLPALLMWGPCGKHGPEI